MKRLTTIIAAMAAFPLAAMAQALLPYQDPSLSFDERAADLTSRLTLEEKARLMLDISEPVERLGIKRFNWWSEALHGLANTGDVTVFPEPIALASTFNDELVGSMFDMVSTEVRAEYNRRAQAGIEDSRFHSLSVWTPNINIFRDPRWGRGQETYGEDPYLMSKMGVAVVHGLQGPADTKYRKLYACAKHYAVHSGPEYSRHTDNLTDVSMRDLYETYLPAFQTVVQKGGVREVMCAYQRLDDDPCCGSDRLLQDILRGDWGFKYMVVSDCSAVSDFWQTHKSSSDARHSAAKAVLAGTDVECGYDYAYKSLPEAVAQGLIKESDVDVHIQRLLRGRFELGEMEQDQSLVEWSKIPYSKVNCQEHRDMALKTARQSIVLLQNRNDVLPLSKKEKVAVIGPNCNDEVLMWGNYNGTPRYTITLLEGVQDKVGKKRVTSFQGCDLVRDQQLDSYYDQCTIDGKTGFRATFYKGRDWKGTPITQVYESRPFAKTTYGNYPFAAGVPLTDFSAVYETVFRPKKTEQVLLEVESCSHFEVWVNDRNYVSEHTWRTTDTRTMLDVEAGKEYRIRILYADIETYNVNLKVQIGRESDLDYDSLIKKLDGINTVVFAGGISARLEGEEMPIDLPGFKGGDRTDIELPAVQREFLKRLHAAGKKVIFVNFSGSAMALVPETESCDAIVQAWYPGEQGGNALADILYGDCNPGGKLPVTFYRGIDQLPDYKDYSMKGRTYRYMTEKPLFPFGYGLSYTTFQMGDMKVMYGGGSMKITIPVTNTGTRDGSETVQVYIHRNDDPEGPVMALRAFKRVEVPAGGTVEAVMEMNQDEFYQWYDEKSGGMKVQPGKFTVWYGNSSDRDALKTFQTDFPGTIW